MEDIFRFKRFSVLNGPSGQKVGTDGVLLGAAVSLEGLPQDARVLDIGTGTGVVALMVAQRLDDAPEQAVYRITAIEIDPDAAARASASFGASPWAEHLECIPASLEAYADSLYRADEAEESPGFAAGSDFHLIVSNPPFYDNYLQSPDSRRAAARSTVSLSYREIITFAHDHLTPGGRLCMILPKDEETRLKRFAASFGFFPERLVNIHTTPAKPPKRIIAAFTRERRRTVTEELILQNDDGSRSAAMQTLTGEFYL